MAKFEIELEVTGIKLKIKGERADIPAITQNLGQQLSGLFEPAANIVEGLPPGKQIESNVTTADASTNGKGSRRNVRPRRSATGNGDVTAVISWQHDPAKWGNPRQVWTGWQKILWLMHVVAREKDLKELSASQIAETFNTHFRQAGLLRKPSMPRDLGTLKQRTPALVGDRADLSPITWFLTEEGIKESVKLVTDAKGGDLLNPPVAT